MSAISVKPFPAFLVAAFVFAVAGLRAQQPAALAAPGTAPPAGVDPRVDALVRKASDYLRAMKSFSFEAKGQLLMEMQGMKNEMTLDYDVALVRPDKFAKVLKNSVLGVTVVTDGKTVWTHAPAAQAYMEKPVGKSLEETLAANNVVAMTGGLDVIGSFAKANPYADFMEGVTGGQLVGTENVGGVQLDHARFQQQQCDWDMWVEPGDKPLIRKIRFDLSKMAKDAQAQMPQDAGSMKIELVVQLDNWTVDQPIPDSRFTFTPPANTKKVDSFASEGGQEEEAPHPLLGKPAPDFSVDGLDGGKFTLSSAKGKSIVILDFWASWCGPCRQALPLVTEAANEYGQKGVLFIAVNVQETPDVIRSFLRDKNPKPPVGLDRDGRVGNLYQVEGIPTTVIVGKDGTVQAVHVGFRPDIKTVLKGQLDDLLAGKNIAQAELDAAKKKTQEGQPAAEAKGVELAWSAPAAWCAVATHAASVIVIDPKGHGAGLSATGQTVAEFNLQDQPSTVRLANLAGDATPEFVTFQGWGPTVRAHDVQGNVLWTYKEGQGVDDVWCADLNGDGFDETIIGYNGGTGLHVLDNRGKLLWSYRQIGNVWHVCAGDVNGDGKLEVVTTSAKGQIHVFDAAGAHLKDIQAPFYANMVRVARAVAAGSPAPILAGGSADAGEAAARLDFAGAKKWEAQLGGGAHIYSAAAASAQPWFAVGTQGGDVVVVNTESGEVVARAVGQGQMPDVAWLEPPGASPLLLVATRTGLNAFRIK